MWIMFVCTFFLQTNSINWKGSGHNAPKKKYHRMPGKVVVVSNKTQLKYVGQTESVEGCMVVMSTCGLSTRRMVQHGWATVRIVQATDCPLLLFVTSLQAPPNGLNPVAYHAPTCKQHVCLTPCMHHVCEVGPFSNHSRWRQSKWLGRRQ